MPCIPRLASPRRATPRHTAITIPRYNMLPYIFRITQQMTLSQSHSLTPCEYSSSSSTTIMNKNNNSCSSNNNIDSTSTSTSSLPLQLALVLVLAPIPTMNQCRDCRLSWRKGEWNYCD